MPKVAGDIFPLDSHYFPFTNANGENRTKCDMCNAYKEEIEREGVLVQDFERS